MMESLQVASVLIGTLIQVLIINWLMIVPTFVMGFLHYHITLMYLATARSVKRLEGNGELTVP